MVKLYLDKALLNESRLLDDGIYKARIVETENKKYSQMDEDYLRIFFEVFDKNGIAKNIYHDFHIYHASSELARKIAHNHLTEICDCVDMDVNELEESDDLLGKELSVKVVTEKNEEYGDRNKIKKFLVSYLNDIPDPKKKNGKEKDGAIDSEISDVPW